MLNLCSCLHCLESTGGLDPSSIKCDHYFKMFGHPHCFTSQFSLRTPRSLKGLCFLTTTLAFCVGIAIGILIPLYFLPPHTIEFEFARNSTVEQFPLVALPLISTSSERSVLTSPPQSPEHMSIRFPEFAHIQNLQQMKSSGEKLLKNHILHRPSSNVQFVATDSRILSLHPVQQEIPQVRLNLTLASSLTSESRTSKVFSETSNLLNGIYWSQIVERMLPKGFTALETSDWRRFVQKTSVVKIEEGCGRMQNRLLSLENGTQACCRYRQNSDQIQGEIFSFYLGQILGLGNLAPSSLDVIQPQNEKWTEVRSQLNSAQWTEGKPVVLTQFIPNLVPAYIPTPFRDSRRSLKPIDILLSANSLESLDVMELAQWSDLIVFDYLTANLDRVVNNLYNLQWNPAMMEAPAHNLAKDASTGLLVFLDNESGLLHGYRLLDKYEQYHRVMLDSLCVFRRSTADAVKKLYKEKKVGSLLKSLFRKLESPLVDYLPTIPDKSIKILNSRIGRVYDQILKCESLYMS